MPTFSGDLAYIAPWWLVFLILGVVNFPTSWLIFRKFSDSGWALAKILGLAAVSFIFFVFSTLGVLPISRGSIFLVILVLLALNFVIFRKKRKEIASDISTKKIPVLMGEILFLLGLLALSYVRAHQPDIRGLEKFMDFGFINSILGSRYLPPADMWYAGGTINYYWFGHLATALVTRLTNLPSSVTYNLMLGTVLGFGLSAAFSMTSSFFEKFGRKALIAGAISALLLCLGGNFHTPFYVLRDGYDKYWYPDATRFIGYNPETNDKTIHEFPSYSFIVSDLHAHVLDFPFVLLFLAILFSQIKFADRKKIIAPQMVALGVVAGIMFSTSTWDFGIYLIVSGLAFLMANLSQTGLSLKTLWSSFRPTLIIAFLGLTFASPFILNFDSIAQGISLVNAKTPVWQLLILWGFPLIISVVYFLRLAVSKEISRSEGFILSLLTASWVLIALPEIFFVKDIYSGSHQRANTMFKLTYQAFVMFYLSSGYVIVTTLSSIKRLHFRLLGVVFASVVISSLLIYPYFGIKSYYGELKTYKGLSGTTWLPTFYRGEAAAVSWFRSNVEGQPTILEAPGDSYTDYNVISSYTGLPTVSGWFVHEWLWRGSPQVPQERVDDVTTVYSSKDTILAKRLLEKYKVEYVVVGHFEKQRFPNLEETKFGKIGNLVFSQDGTNIYKIGY